MATPTPAPVWDFDLRKRLRHGDGEFQLQLACQSHAQRLVLFGPSGAGKTLALKMIAGLVAPDAGHVRLAGRTLFDRQAGVTLTPQARRTACLFQDYALFPHLTVRQNVAFGRRRGWFNPVSGPRDAEVERWLQVFGLQDHARHYPHQISGGQKQRTALARALVAQPSALLLDEPFAALDKPMRERLRDELCELQRALAIPMLVITHDEDDVCALGDEVLSMAAGRTAAAGVHGADTLA